MRQLLSCEMNTRLAAVNMKRVEMVICHFGDISSHYWSDFIDGFIGALVEDSKCAERRILETFPREHFFVLVIWNLLEKDEVSSFPISDVLCLIFLCVLEIKLGGSILLMF